MCSWIFNFQHLSTLQTSSLEVCGSEASARWLGSLSQPTGGVLSKTSGLNQLITRPAFYPNASKSLVRWADSSSFHTDQFKVQTTHPATCESLQSLASTLSQGSRPLPIKLLPLPSSSSVVRTALARKMQALSPQDQCHCWSKWLVLGAMVILCHPSWLIIRNPVSSQPVATPIPMIHHLCQPKKRQERPAADVEQNGRSSRPGREVEIKKTF